MLSLIRTVTHSGSLRTLLITQQRLFYWVGKKKKTKPFQTDPKYRACQGALTAGPAQAAAGATGILAGIYLKAPPIFLNRVVFSLHRQDSFTL